MSSFHPHVTEDCSHSPTNNVSKKTPRFPPNNFNIISVDKERAFLFFLLLVYF